MLFDKDVMLRYSEWLDQEGLIIGDGTDSTRNRDGADFAPRKQPGEDKRSHEDLVQAFFAYERVNTQEGTMPAGWHDLNQREADRERKLAGTQDMLRMEQALRVEAERRMNDRAFYVPRDSFDKKAEALSTMQDAYTTCRQECVDKIKENMQLRGKLSEAYGVLAGYWSPTTDAELAQVIYNRLVQGDWKLDHGGWDTLSDRDKERWINIARDIRGRVAGGERNPLNYQELARAYGEANAELDRLRSGMKLALPDHNYDESSIVDVALLHAAIVHEYGVFCGRLMPTVERLVAMQETSEYNELERELAGRLQETREHAEGEPVNLEQSAQDAARSMAQELGRLSGALRKMQVPLREGPLHGAEVDTAVDYMADLRTQIQDLQGNPNLSTATTEQLLDELVARGKASGWPSIRMQRLQRIIHNMSPKDMEAKGLDDVQDPF